MDDSGTYGAGHHEGRVADLAPVAQQADVARPPVRVSEVHRLGDRAPAHPDSGLHHSDQPCHQQDIPAGLKLHEDFNQ